MDVLEMEGSVVEYGQSSSTRTLEIGPSKTAQKLLIADRRPTLRVAVLNLPNGAAALKQPKDRPSFRWRRMARRSGLRSSSLTA